MTVALMLHRADGTIGSDAFRRTAFGPSDPFVHQREVAWEGPAAMSAGRVRWTGVDDIAHYPHTETIVVCEGTLTLIAEGCAPLVLRPADGAVIARGSALRILAPQPVVFVFCAAATTSATQPGLTRLGADASLQPSSPPPTEVLLGPVPQCRSDNAFTDEASDYRAGIWDSTPYHRVIRPHRVNEFMFLLAGGVRFASPDGHVLTAGAGDALFVPQGTPVGWESRVHVAKIYVVQEVKA